MKCKYYLLYLKQKHMHIDFISNTNVLDLKD